MKLTPLIFSACLALAATAPAALTYKLSETGFFGPTTTLNGVALGAVKAFSFDAEFDPTADLNGSSNRGLYAVSSFSITIDGTTYTASPAPSLNVQLRSLFGSYAAGLAVSNVSDGFRVIFSGASPDFSADAPEPSVLSGPGGYAVLFSGYNITLDGGAGDLVVKDIANDTSFTAAITAVPEPSIAGITLLGAGVFFLRRRRA